MSAQRRMMLSVTTVGMAVVWATLETLALLRAKLDDSLDERGLVPAASN